MNSPQCGLRLAGTIFGLVCLAHLVRLLNGSQVMISSYLVPMWLSGAGFVVSGLLALWLWRLSLPAGTVPPPAKT